MTATEIPVLPDLNHSTERASAGKQPATADPGLLGYPAFATAAFALALFLTGFNQVTIPSTLAAPLPIMSLCGVLLIGATVWAVRRGDGWQATMFGLFGAFWLSFSMLVFGLVNSWFGQLPEPAQRGAQANFILVWLGLMTVVTLTTLRLPKIFGLLFLVIDFSLLTLFVAVSVARPGAAGDPWILPFGIIAIFSMPLIGMYLFAGSLNAFLGGKMFPVGKPFKS
ncbi:GPR1/FUN34/YaaH family transporter [Microbispora sp. NBC_01389]|uniref:GPR1/FUN34/YaaH family transporter n=1 Tax=Microbispora sp. NBC_01389 TaxID=2903584 RepID=UPI00324FA50D